MNHLPFTQLPNPQRGLQQPSHISSFSSKMKHVLIASTFLLLLSCCKDDTPEPSLPPITTTGANTFGCRINGKVWLPSPRPSGNLPQIEGGIKTRFANGGPEKNWYDLLIFADRNDLTGFSIYLSRINKNGIFSLNKTTFPWPQTPQPNHSYMYYYFHSNAYMTDSIFSGEVELTRCDTLNKIFSGTFHFRAVYGVDTISVTEGRFDIDQKKIN